MTMLTPKDQPTGSNLVKVSYALRPEVVSKLQYLKKQTKMSYPEILSKLILDAQVDTTRRKGA